MPSEGVTRKQRKELFVKERRGLGGPQGLGKEEDRISEPRGTMDDLHQDEKVMRGVRKKTKGGKEKDSTAKDERKRRDQRNAED